VGRTCAIGLDAGSIEFIDELCERGVLPNLTALRARSARLGLSSAPYHRHGTLWTQFVTGTQNTFDRTGFRFFFDPATYEPYEKTAQHDAQGVAPFWERITGRSITFDVPASTISGRGVAVTAWGAHAASYPRASNPRGLLREIDSRFGVHPGFENEYECGWHDPRRLELLTTALEVGAVRRAEICTDLMTRFADWQLFTVVFSEAHSASEMMWHSVDPDHPLAAYDPQALGRLERTFIAIDRAVGAIASSLRPDDTLFLFSLDGMQSSHGDLSSIVLMPELLHRAHFGTPFIEGRDPGAWRHSGFPPVVPRRGVTWRHELDRRLVGAPAPSWRDRAQRSRSYTALRLTPPGRAVVERIKGAPLGALGIPIPPESEEDAATIESRHGRADELLFLGNYRPFRSQMRSFVLPSFGDGYLRINLRGRERDGRVAISEYDEERRRLDALVLACRNPRTGHLVADEIEWFDAATALDPERRPYADGIVHWNEPTDAFEHPDIGLIGPFPLHRTGIHAARGFVWASGPEIQPGVSDDRPVLDLAPTILCSADPSASLPPSGQPIPFAG